MQEHRLTNLTPHYCPSSSLSSRFSTLCLRCYRGTPSIHNTALYSSLFSANVMHHMQDKSDQADEPISTSSTVLVPTTVLKTQQIFLIISHEELAENNKLLYIIHNVDYNIYCVKYISKCVLHIMGILNTLIFGVL